MNIDTREWSYKMYQSLWPKNSNVSNKFTWKIRFFKNPTGFTTAMVKIKKLDLDVISEMLNSNLTETDIVFKLVVPEVKSRHETSLGMTFGLHTLRSPSLGVDPPQNLGLIT